METKIKNRNGEFTVFVDPDPYKYVSQEAEYSVQVINETKRNTGELHVGVMTEAMKRDDAINLYRRTAQADNPEAYLRAVIQNNK